MGGYSSLTMPAGGGLEVGAWGGGGIPAIGKAGRDSEDGLVLLQRAKALAAAATPASVAANSAVATMVARQDAERNRGLAAKPTVEHDHVLARAKAVLAQSYDDAEGATPQKHGHGHGHGATASPGAEVGGVDMDLLERARRLCAVSWE